MPKLRTPKYLPKDHLTLFLPLLDSTKRNLNKGSQEQNPTAHSTNTGSFCSQNFPRIQGKYKIGREAACLKKERPDPDQVPTLSGRRERSVPMAGRDPYPSQVTVQLFWHNPRDRAGDKMKNRGWNMRPGLVEPCRIYFCLNA